MEPHRYLQLGSVVLLLTLISFVALRRGRIYAIFVGVVLGIHTLIVCGIADRFGPLLPLAAYLQLAVYVHFATLVRGRLRGLAYRALVSWPASAFAGGVFLAMPWSLLGAFGVKVGLFGAPFALALVGLGQSLRSGFETVTLGLDGDDAGPLARGKSGSLRVERPLRIAQITDPHLGPFMSANRLRRIVERAVAQQPDLVLLTGDFLTMESHTAPKALEHALAPLLPLAGKTFACRGNHDFEAPATVEHGLASAGVRYLIDAEALVDTPAGKVQLVGLDFCFRDRERRMREVLERYPRRPGHLRLILLHDPGAFTHLPDGDADLVLSGHTHGGQLGLVSLGIPTTFVSLFTKIPDHGLWQKGRNRLYVHRGTGVYGFPLRVGVPGEESVLEVHAQMASAQKR